MALSSVGFSLVLTLIDSAGVRRGTTKTFDLTAADYATAVTDTATIIAAFNAVSSCVITGYSITHKFYEDTVIVTPASVHHEIRANISVELVGKSDSGLIQIPGADQTVVFKSTTGPDSEIVDTVDTDVLAYVALFQAGGEATLSDGDVAGGIVNGKQVSIKRTKVKL